MRTLVGVVAAVVALTHASVPALPVSKAPPLLRQVAAIPLPGIEGRIDHMVLDDSGQRLFVVALGNNSVEVLDMRAGRRIRSLTGFSEPQGVAYVTSPPRLFVTNGGDGTCAVFDGRSLRALRPIPLGDHACNVRLDAKAGRVYVGYG